MGIYSRFIFPRLCDLVLDRPFVAEHRRNLLADASGEILEIGFEEWRPQVSIQVRRRGDGFCRIQPLVQHRQQYEREDGRRNHSADDHDGHRVLDLVAGQIAQEDQLPASSRLMAFGASTRSMAATARRGIFSFVGESTSSSPRIAGLLRTAGLPRKITSITRSSS